MNDKIYNLLRLITIIYALAILYLSLTNKISGDNLDINGRIVLLLAIANCIYILKNNTKK